LKITVSNSRLKDDVFAIPQVQEWIMISKGIVAKLGSGG
jgi:hypothetical protein